MAASDTYYPDVATVKKYARSGNLIPVYREILADTETPVSAFMKLNQCDNCFLLESVEGGEKWARYSFIGLNPSALFTSKGSSVTITNGRKIDKYETDNPLAVLRSFMNKYKPVKVEGLPRFCGGAVGYIGYDMVRFIEELPDLTEDDTGWFDSYLMITDSLVIFDNLKHNVKIVSNIYLEDETDITLAYARAIKTIDEVVRKLHKPLRLPSSKPVGRNAKFRSNIKKDNFKKIVKKAKEYIRAGDIIQVVLSQRFETDLQVEPFELYRSLRVVNPSPYMYYLKMKDNVIVGSSPEVLVRLEDDEIFLRPIAGTRPRGKTKKEDLRLAEDLKKDIKEIAEHVMLVDLGRNDVGRVAQMGTVNVDDFMVIERYSHVMHLVSSVTGTLKKGADAYDVFSACFPAGTVSGAPKIRAMQIIEELEQHKRGPYAGSIGYFGFSGNLDFCITIRTMLICNDKIYIQAGAGIVLDSKPENEFVETQNKARGMIKAVDKAHEGL
ncbi:MAG: anthranilate synthase component I [Deltaproteobacteria bacterium]|nr:anthranilate synthase component I [Deltaproteobacteria bacterium]